jgi:hypothetical protein
VRRADAPQLIELAHCCRDVQPSSTTSSARLQPSRLERCRVGAREDAAAATAAMLKHKQ